VGDVAVGGDDDHREGRPALRDPLQQLESIDSGKLDVDDDDPGQSIGMAGEESLGGSELLEVGAGPGQRLAYEPSQKLFVVNNIRAPIAHSPLRSVRRGQTINPERTIFVSPWA
jgi:hypothetical protein